MYFIGGVGRIKMFDADELFGTARTLMTSTITISNSNAEVRGDIGNVLYGKYFHSTKFDLKIEDAMFRMAFLAKNIGANITVGGDAFTTEEVTLTTGGAGIVSSSPIDFAGYGTIGWVSLANNEDWRKITFSGTSFTSPIGSSGDTVYVTYKNNNTAAQQIIVSSNIIPATVRMVMDINLYSGASTDIASSTKVGTVQVEIPRFIFDGQETLDLSASGVSKIALNGSALSVNDNAVDGGGYYAIITQAIDNTNWYDDVYALAAVDDDIALSSSVTTYLLDLRALALGKLPFKPIYSDLTFTSSATEVVTCSSAGLLTKVASGDAVVNVKITNKTSVETNINVTVS